MPERAYVALGSNLGDREAHLAHARARLAVTAGVQLVAASPIEETAPVGPVPQGPYLNQMIAVETTLSPEALLDLCLTIEAERGRERAAGVRWAARTLDLDLVLFGARELDTPRLRLPHPELPHRDFWQRGLDALGVGWQGTAGVAA